MVDINFLPKKIRKEIVKSLHEKFPKKDFKVTYIYNPFVLGYAVGYLLNGNHKQYGHMGQSITPMKLYDIISVKYQELEFDELINIETGGVFKYNGESYGQYNHMFQFLINDCGYKHSKNRIVRYMENPISNRKYYVNYNYDGSPYKKNDKEVPEKREEDKQLDDRLIYLKLITKL